jgi:D-alanyl-D-alanine dipeptidase
MKLHSLPVLALFFLLFSVSASFSQAKEQADPLPKGFVYADEVVPDLRLDLRYATNHNFVGEHIDGYVRPRPILTREAAEALKKAQEELRSFGLGLKVFDAYRPQRAVDHFVRWAKDVKDTRMKAEFYPGVRKEDLFRDDYIAAKSGHSRGSTVDLTIVPLDEASARELDMGSGFDFFGPESWPTFSGISPERRAHRMLLQILMKRCGFKPYPKEWWHFTLENEPFPDTYFDFSVR